MATAQPISDRTLPGNSQISSEDNIYQVDNSDDIFAPTADCKTPTITQKNYIPYETVSLNGFHNLVIDDFINPALNVLDLSEYLPDDGKFAQGESGINMVFRSSSSDFRMSQARSFCCRPCGPGCCRLVCSPSN